MFSSCLGYRKRRNRDFSAAYLLTDTIQKWLTCIRHYERCQYKTPGRTPFHPALSHFALESLFPPAVWWQTVRPTPHKRMAAVLLSFDTQLPSAGMALEHIHNTRVMENQSFLFF